MRSISSGHPGAGLAFALQLSHSTGRSGLDQICENGSRNWAAIGESADATTSVAGPDKTSDRGFLTTSGDNFPDCGCEQLERVSHPDAFLNLMV